MFKLILKDIILFKKTLVFSFIYIIFVIAIVFRQENLPSMATFPIFLLSTFTPVIFMLGTSLTYEDKFKSDILFNSLPLNRRTIVLAKYLSFIIYYLIGIVFYFLSIFFLRFLNFNITIQKADILVISLSLFAVSIYTGISLFLYYSFGQNTARIFNFVFMVIIFGLFKEFVLSLKKHNLLSTITRYLQTLNNIQISFLLLFVSLVIITISLLISTKTYSNKDF